MTYEVYIVCNECGESLGCDFDQNYSTLTLLDNDWREIEPETVFLIDGPKKRSRHICPDCYEGSSYERDDLHDSHVDSEIKREKECG